MQAAAPTLASELDAHLIALWKAVGRVQRHELSRTAASVLASLRDGGPQRITALAVAGMWAFVELVSALFGALS